MDHTFSFPAMPDVEVAANAYLQLAESLYEGQLAEADLVGAARSLPPLNQALLGHLLEIGKRFRGQHPRQRWALAAVTDAAAGHGEDVFLGGRAAWVLACAANEWVRPGRVEEAANRAHRLFQQANEPAWMAAAAWQRDALPWTRPSFVQAREALAATLETLEAAAQEDGRDSDFALFAALCRLSLAYAQLLTGNYETARENATLSENFFREPVIRDPFYLGWCHFVQAALYRRGTQMQEAIARTEQALEIFEGVAIPGFTAQALCQRAYNQLQAKTQYPEALATFSEAAARFAELDMPLWGAQCAQGKAQVYIATGRLANARQALQEARAVYKRYDVPGPLSDALLDSGWLEMLYGNFQDSLTYFSEAQALSDRMGYQQLTALTEMHRAKGYVALGRYQHALASLEQAEEVLGELGVPGRQAECELRLADVWSQLGQPARAHAYLDQAIAHFEEAKRSGVLAYVYARRAEILFGEGNVDEAVSFLQKSLAEAEGRDDQPTAARAQRYLGEALCAAGRADEAVDHLRAAEAAYARMHMPREQAACQVALGHCHRRRGDASSARRAWYRALNLGAGAMPDIIWQSRAGLARLAETEGDEAALSHYRQVVEALERLRRRLWQPALVDAFLQRPSAALDRAVALAARMGQGQEALSFIEASKAQTVAREILAEHQQRSHSGAKALGELVAEIRWLNEEIQASMAQHTGWKRPPRERELRRRLSQAVEEYDRRSARLERMAFARDTTAPPPDFNLDALRRGLETALGSRWLALDYYRTDDGLICVAVTPDECHVATTRVSAQAYTALERFGRGGRHGEGLERKDLLALGRALIPDVIRPLLRPDAHLLIVPHRDLHHLPWAALFLPPDEEPLAARCIPVLAPSLSTLVLLRQRASTTAPAGRRPLLLAVSDFQGRHPPLPAVLREADALLHILGPETALLAGEDATWPALQRLANGAGLNRFALLHVASHAFHDSISGRLSGLALYDQDVWLEELKQCAPLPPVVTLSACSGSVSRVYRGDEHVSLTTTCLAAGAQSVVGSIWPVPDIETANPMLDVYENLVNSATVAEALAHAQRAAWEKGLPVSRWGGFRCTGLPAPSPS